MFNTSKSAWQLTLSACALFTLGLSAAHAQDADIEGDMEDEALAAESAPAEDAPEEKVEEERGYQVAGMGTEEIVVTARKRTESLEDVPISITAFSADKLQAMGLGNNDDIATMTVNFNTQAQLGRRLDRPVIRGMSAPATFGEPNASYFIDGVYLSGSVSAYTLGPIERVEILRGPQSTQFGRATFSGAVNYVTRKPTNDLAGELTLRAGEEGTRTFAGWASGPLIKDKLLFFTSASYDQYDGEWNNELQDGQAGNTNLFINPPQIGDDSDLGGTQTKQVEGKLVWLIDDTSEMTFKAGYVKGDDDHYPQLIVETDELNCFRPGIDITDPNAPNYSRSPGAYCGKIDEKHRQNRMNLPDFRTGMTSILSNQVPTNDPNSPLFGKLPEDYISVPRTPGQERDQYNYMIGYEKDFSDWTFNVKGAYNKSELTSAYDLDGYETRSLTGQFGFYEELNREDYSFEARVDSPAAESVRGSLGVYYYNFQEDSANQASPGLTGLGQLTDTTDSETNNYALFGGLEYDFNDQWTASVEARWARDVKEIDAPNSCNDPTSDFFDPGNNLIEKQGKNSLTPRFTLRWQPNDNLSNYVQVAKGNKPGAYNIGYYREGRDACFAAEAVKSGDVGPYVDEEKQWTYEVGTKTNWLDNRITANLAAFYIDWDNQTFFEITDIPGEVTGIPTSVGFNGGESRIFGLEFESSFAFTDKLLGTFAYGFTDGKIKEAYSCTYANATGEGLIPNGSGGFTCATSKDQGLELNNLKDKETANSPRHSIVTSLAYADSISADMGWFARTDYAWEDGRYADVNNFAEIGSRRTWNARSGLETADWTLSFYVNNILDENTPSAIINFPRFGEINAGGSNSQGYALTPTRGRIIGGEVILRFGDL